MGAAAEVTSRDDGLEGASTPFRRGDYATALFAAAVALAAYVPLLSTSIPGEDAGELAAAAYVLGIPHPPGYPLWCLIAHVFTWLPLYTVAWRVALCSAALAAATLGVTTLLAIRVTGSRWMSLVGAFTLLASFDFLGAATVPEVYSLNALLLALSWLWLALWRHHQSDRYLWALAITQGLNFANHNTAIALAPCFALFILFVEWRQPSGHRVSRLLGKFAAMSMLSLGIAFVFYCYLPIRSAANPPIDWGNPETLTGWWRHFTREQYNFMAWENPRSLTRFASQMYMHGGFWVVQFGFVAPLFGVFGLLACVRSTRHVSAMIFFSALFTFLCFVIIQNPSKTREWIAVMRVFSIPLSLAVSVGVALWLARSRGHWRLGEAAIVLLSATVLLGGQYYSRLTTGTHAVEDYARKVFEVLPQNAIWVPAGDHQSFPLQYLQIVEGLRPDVSIARKYGYFDLSLLPPEFAEKYGEQPARRHEPELIGWLLSLSTRPVYVAKRPSLEDASIHFEACWLMERAMRPGETTASNWSEAECALSPDSPLLLQAIAEARGGDYTASVIAMEWCFKSAAWCFEGGQEGALKWLERGLSVYGRNPTALYNAGAICARYQEYDAARGYFADALKMDATHAPSIAALQRLDANQ